MIVSVKLFPGTEGGGSRKQGRNAPGKCCIENNITSSDIFHGVSSSSQSLTVAPREQIYACFLTFGLVFAHLQSEDSIYTNILNLDCPSVPAQFPKS